MVLTRLALITSPQNEAKAGGREGLNTMNPGGRRTVGC